MNMKSTGGLSLSMKMRAESMSVDKKSTKNDSASLPKVDQYSGINRNRILSMTDDSIKCTNKAARLSGSIGYTAGTSADRTQTIRPSICCVRCSLHASICMDCCDLQTQNAIAFYRRTLGKGASDILSRAIMEAGLGNMSKHIIFTLWKNGCRSRIRRRLKESIELGLRYETKMMRRPLAAWKKFTQDEILRKKKKAISDLEYKCKQLEKKMEQIIHTSEKTESEMNRLQDQMIRSVAVTEGFIETIRGLKGQLAEEKSRVLVLSSMCGHVRTLSTALSTYVKEEYNSNSRALTESGSTVPSYHYGNLYPSASRDVIQNFTKLRIERTMGESVKTRFLYKLETDASNKMLIQWVNYVSRECVNSLPRILQDKTGDDDSIDFSLPKHEQVYEVTELRNGKTLSRVVFFLIYSISQFGENNTCKLPAENSTIEEEKEVIVGKTDNIEFGKKNEKELLFTRGHLTALKEAENDPEILLELTVKYASDFLFLPLYNFQDIADGTKKETFTFLGNLFISSTPTSVGKEEQNTQILLTENNEVQIVLQKSLLKAEQGKKWLIEVERALNEYHLPSKKIPVGGNINLNRIQANTLEQDIKSSNNHKQNIKNSYPSVTLKEGAHGGTLDPDSVHGNGASMAGNLRIQGKLMDQEPMIVLKSEHVNYNNLQRSIDGLLSPNGLVYFEHSLKALTDNITKIVEMKKVVAESQKRKYEEIRTATDIRVFVSKNLLQNLATPLGMVKVET